MLSAPLFVRIVFVMAALATTTPIFGGYFCALLLLLWIPFGRRKVDASTQPLADAMAKLLEPVSRGVLGMVVAYVVAAIVGWALSPFATPFYDAFHAAVRMGIKWGLLWFVLAHGMLIAARRGWAAREIGLTLAAGMVVTLVYCVAQRYTGIDWTHGLDARLGPHRFAYGVYRISGFMGHPLTLAYNLMLMVLTALALSWPLAGACDRKERWAWGVVAAAGVAILLISGSRFVLLVVPAVVVLAEGGRLAKHFKWVVLAVGVLGLALWWEGSVVGRFGEFFDQSAALTERFPRIVFWQVHLRMFLDHPVAGVTQAGLDQAMAAYYAAAGRPEMINTAHNVFLQTLADSGLIGAAGLLGLLWGLVVAARRARQLLGHASGVGLLLAATVLSGMMQNNLRDSEYVYALWFFLALLLLRSAGLASGAGRARCEGGSVSR